MTQRKYGRRTPKNAPALRLGPLLTGVVPAHPTAQDNLSSLTGWKMLGNDQAGDCVAVTWATFRRLMTAVLGDREVYPGLDQVWAVYKTQNPGFDPNGNPNVNGPGSTADQGMDIQTLLEYLVKTGGPDGVKAIAFAKVDHNNPAEVDAALSIFGALWTGVTVQAAQQDQFAAGQAWDWIPGSPEEGGHSILSGGYTTTGVKAETWASEITLTSRYLRSGVEELWVVIWPEHLGSKAFQAGVDHQALARDYTALTGRPFPVAPPEPDPLPPISADETFAQILKPWAAKAHLCGKAVAQAGRDWLAAKGL